MEINGKYRGIDMIIMNHLSMDYLNQHQVTKVLENINLKISDGEICAIVGPSGAGKTTLLKILAGIIGDYEGEVSLKGEKIDPKNHRIGWIPQNYGLMEWKTVEKNIFLSAKIKDGRNHIDIPLYEMILSKLKIHHLKHKYPNQLSGGERQRVAIARAFLLKPTLLLMDESFSALDAMTREDARELFLQIWKFHRVTTVLVTHDLREALYLGEKIVVMSSMPGRIVQMTENPFFGRSAMELEEGYISLYKGLLEGIKGKNQ